jgi:hypothetical protein
MSDLVWTFTGTLNDGPNLFLYFNQNGQNVQYDVTIKSALGFNFQVSLTVDDSTGIVLGGTWQSTDTVTFSPHPGFAQVDPFLSSVTETAFGSVTGTIGNLVINYNSNYLSGQLQAATAIDGSFIVISGTLYEPLNLAPLTPFNPPLPTGPNHIFISDTGNNVSSSPPPPPPSPPPPPPDQTEILNGQTGTVLAGQTGANYLVDPGGTLNCYGTVSNVNCSGIANLYGGGEIDNLTLQSGGSLSALALSNGARVAQEVSRVSLGAVQTAITNIRDSIQLSNGTIGRPLGGALGTATDAQSTDELAAAGAVTSATATAELDLFAGASAVNQTIYSGGLEFVGSGASSTGTSLQGGTVTIGGGFVELAGGANSGTVMFQGGGKLQMDQPGTYNDVLSGSASGMNVAAYGTARNFVSIAHSANGSLLLTNGQGTDTLSHIDQVRFTYGVMGTPYDFNGGGQSGLLLRNGSTGAFEVYNIANNALAGAASMGAVGLNWQVAGFGDFTGSGYADMMMRNTATGAFEVYDIANNALTAAYSMGVVGLNWQVVGFGDFTGSGTSDMLMRNTATGAFEVYDIVNNALAGAFSMGAVGLNWQVVGFGGFAGDGTSDMLMRNTSTGAFEVYDISHNALTAAYSMGAVGLNWQVVGFGDFAGNGTSDMLMRNTTTGQFEVYDISHNQLVSAQSMGAVGLDWQVLEMGSFHGDFTGDMLMQNTKTGALEVYDITGNTLTAAYSMGAVGLNWQGTSPSPTPPPAAKTQYQYTGPAFTYTALNGAPPGDGTDLTATVTFNTDMSNANGWYGAPASVGSPLTIVSDPIVDVQVRSGTYSGSLSTATSLSQGGPDFYFQNGVITQWFINFRSGQTSFLTEHWPVSTEDSLFLGYPTGTNGTGEIGGVGSWTAVSAGSVGAGGAADPPTLGGLGASSVELGSTSQLVQAMAGFGGGSGAGESLNSIALDADASQPTLLTMPQQHPA